MYAASYVYQVSKCNENIWLRHCRTSVGMLQMKTAKDNKLGYLIPGETNKGSLAAEGGQAHSGEEGTPGVTVFKNQGNFYHVL